MALRSLELEGFRGFKEFSMPQLGVVNLLLGKNNSGKSSVLEAVELLLAQGSAGPLWMALSRRGELLSEEDQEADFAKRMFVASSTIMISALGLDWSFVQPTTINHRGFLRRLFL